MKLSPFPSKLVFLSSLAYFTLTSSDVFSSGSCTDAGSSGSCTGNTWGSCECSQSPTGTFCISGGETFVMNSTFGDGPFYVYGSGTIDNQESSSEFDFQVTSSGAASITFTGSSNGDILQLQNIDNAFGDATLNFNSGTVQIGSSSGGSTISGAGAIVFDGGYLGAPYGATIDIPITVNTAFTAIYGGTDSTAPLIITGQMDLNGNQIVLSSGYIEISPSSTSNTGSGVFDLQNGTTLISGQDALGTNSFSMGASAADIATSILQFPEGADTTITSVMAFNLDVAVGGTVDTNGGNVTWNGSIINENSDTAQLQIIDSTGSSSGFFNIGGTSASQLSSTIEFFLTSGTLTTNFSSTLANPITFQGGALEAQGITYSGAITVTEDTENTIYFTSDVATTISGVVTGSGTLNITSGTAALGSSLTISDGTGFSGFSGTLNIAPSAALTVNIDPDNCGTGTITLNENGTLILTNTESIATTIYATITPQGGGQVTFSTTNDITLTQSIGTGGSGSFSIDFTNSGTITAGTGVNIGGVIIQEGQVSLTSGSVLFYGDDTSTSRISTVTGSLLSTGTDVIIGDGAVDIFGDTFFGTSSSNIISNSFTGGLTLSSGSLTFYSVDSLGTGPITGSGGTLSGEDVAMTITNEFIFSAGHTTTFENFYGFTLTGDITVTGAGVAEIVVSSGTLTLDLSSSTLGINEGTSLQTNGNFLNTYSATGDSYLITETLSGEGGLILGGGSTHSPITDIITISGTTASTFNGNISDNSSGGKGAVVIAAPVTFTGTNTFTGGITLSPNSDTDNTAELSVALSVNVNGGTSTNAPIIYGNGGGINVYNATSSSKETVTFYNNWVLTQNTDTAITVVSGVTLDLEGTFSVSSSGTAAITKDGDGTLTIGTDGSFTSGTYEFTLVKGPTQFDATPVTTSSYFLQDGILWGDQRNYFALADAFYEPWGIRQVTLDPDPIVNIILQGDGTNPSLRGTGSVTNVQVYEGGIVAPGVSSTIGALEVTDSIEFFSGSIFAIAITTDSGSILNVGNNVVIDSSVFVSVAPKSGPYLETSHVILTAGALDGEFAGFVIPASFFLDGLLDYSIPNEVILNIIPRTVLSLANGANAIAVAESLDKVIAWNRENVSYDFTTTPDFTSSHPFVVSDVPALLENVLDTLAPFTTEEEMTAALNQLQPAFLKGFTIVQEDNIVKMRDTLSYRMDYILDTNTCFTFSEDKTCCSKDDKIMHAWISGMGDVLAQDSNTYADSPQVGYQSKMGGFAAGVDGHFAKVLYIGGIGGYTTSYVKWKQDQGTGNINTGYAGLYLSAISDMFYGNLSVIGGFSDFSSKRNIQYTGVDLTASGKHSGKQLLSHADTGFNFNIGGFTIRPFDSLDYVTQTETAYTETGSGEWDLSVDKVNAIFIRNELGLTLATCLCFSDMKWIISPKASWVREVRVKGDTFTASFAEAAPADAEFTVTGYFPDRSLFSPGVSLTGAMCQDRLTVQLNYNGAFMHGYSDHSYGGEVRYAF